METKKTFASVDIGSNAARILIKKVTSEPQETLKYEKLLFFRYPLRLGDDVFTEGKISSDKIVKLIHFLKAFKHLMKLYNVDDYRICATSAMRDAINKESVRKIVKEKTKFEFEILDGSKEAQMVYTSHIEQGLKSIPKNCAFVDIGGGSTEITIIKDGEIVSSTSFNIGSIRKLHMTEEEIGNVFKLMEEKIKTDVFTEQNINIVGSGGNINKLYKLCQIPGKNRDYFTSTELGKIYEQLNKLSLKDRMDIFNLKSDRADVIIPASEILIKITTFLKSDKIFVPTLGLTDGIIDNMFLNQK